MGLEPLTPALIMRLSVLDALSALEETISLTRVALANSFERPTMDMMRSYDEQQLVLALNLLFDSHDSLAAASEADPA